VIAFPVPPTQTSNGTPCNETRCIMRHAELR
jgi:hypothetical protein